MNAVKRPTEPLGEVFLSGNPNPCAPGANQLADLVADVPALPAPPEDDLAGLLAAVTSADLARLLEDAPGLPGLCALSADELEDLAPDPDLDPDPVPPSLEDLTARMNAGLKAIALLLAASAELLQASREAREGGAA